MKWEEVGVLVAKEKCFGGECPIVQVASEELRKNRTEK